jgi:hypothetical protein
VVHESQRLALGLKTCEHLFGVHTSLDELQCDLALDGLQLLGLPDLAHTAFAQLLEKAVVAQYSILAAFAKRSFLGIDSLGTGMIV